jgi:hypothetical protein
MITCDQCSGPAHVRIGATTFCRTCAHVAIDASAPASIATDRTDDDTLDALRLVAMTRKGPVKAREIRSMVKGSFERVYQALSNLERSGFAVRDAKRRGWFASPAAMQPTV